MVGLSESLKVATTETPKAEKLAILKAVLRVMMTVAKMAA